MSHALLSASTYIVLAVATGLRLLEIDGFLFIEVNELMPLSMNALAELLEVARGHGFQLDPHGITIEEAWLFDDGLGDRIALVRQ